MSFQPGMRTTRRGIRLALLAVACGWFPLPCALSQTSQRPSAAVTEAAGQQTPGAADAGIQSSAPQDSQSEKDRLNVNPVTGQTSASASDYTPLTGDERLKLYFKQTYWSIGAYFGPFFSALLLDQTTGDPKEWGGGFKGYSRRVLSRWVAGDLVQNSFQHPAAALLKEDVRYITSTQHGFKRRAGHAVLYSFLTYNNQGRATLNISNLAGYYAASAASTLWVPGHGNTALFALSDGSQAIGLSVPVNLVQEFWPEIRRSVFRRR